MNESDEKNLRAKARSLLAQQPNLADVESLTQKNLMALVEELQIYLAELEVQNQQLRDIQVKLEQHQVQYKNLFEHLPIAAFLLNEQGIIIENNEQAEWLFAQRNTHHLKNHSIYRFLGRNNGQWLHSRLNDLQNTSALSAEFDCQVQGEHIPVKISIVPIKKTAHKQIERLFIVTLLDLSAQYRRQKEWRMFQGILDHSSVMIYAFDRDGYCLLANQKVAELFGCSSPVEMIGKAREELMSLHDANRHFDHDLQVLRTQKPIQVKESLPKRDRVLYFLTDKFPLFDTNAEVFAIGGITYDITEQTEQQKQLSISNELFTKGQDGLMVCDPQARILSVNSAFEEITGYSQSECLQQNPRFLSSGRHDLKFYQDFWHSLLTLGYWRGEIWNRRKNGEIYPQQLSVSAIKDSDGKLINYLGVFNDITEKKQAEEEIMQLAFYDSLTGVANRILLRERAEQLILEAQRNPTSFSLFFIDLDHFKEVNDVHGHDMGDLILKQATQRIKVLIRPQDTLARLGGDEFAVLFPHVGVAQSLELGERLVTSLAEPYSIKDKTLYLSASIGIAQYPEDAYNYSVLLKHADLAMYHAKSQGRNSVYLFRDELEAQLTRSVNIETELRHALERKQLYLMFQPQYEIEMQTFIGFEALLRWQHPQMGEVSPDVFIPMAERSDLIIDLTDWVLSQSLAFLARIHHHAPEMRLSVNISAREFSRSDFVHRIEQSLAQFPQVKPEQLELEITERIAMEQPDKVLYILNALRRLGVTLALDDFGTGYSSLTYLKKYPLQVLKIDKSFVDDIGIDPEDEAVCKAIITMAKAMNYLTIAEGVESQQQVEFLTEQGCDMIQGYYFARPMSEDQLIANL